MFEKMDHSHSVALDEVMKARHTVRGFSPEPLKKEDVDQIIEAGLIAPFAMMSVIGRSDFRKFFVFPAGSPNKDKIKNIVKARFPEYIANLDKTAGNTPFAKMLKGGGPGLADGLFDKPCVVIAAERWGIPAIAPESLSFCLENMWLKATTLKVGFQLLSVISGQKLGNDKEFCDLLGIPCGEYYLDGFALGYPAPGFKPAPVKYPELESSVRWL